MLSSELSERESQIDKMISYFLNCGYKRENLVAAKTKAMCMNRSDLLSAVRPATELNSLVFVLHHSVDIPNIRLFLSTQKDILLSLTGMSDVIFATKTKMNLNTSSLLFNKFGFAQSNNRTDAINQKCGQPNCKCCPLMFDMLQPVSVAQNGIQLRLKRTATCKSEDVIYMFQCRLCKDVYFGRSMNRANIRVSGHRACFKPNKLKDSAMATHIFKDHIEELSEGLNNFNFGILETTTPTNLARREDFYVWSTNASVLHLNRYKVT